MVFKYLVLDKIKLCNSECQAT